ncbi:molybdopterin cofactor-binding domain-containing protein [Sciscionella sediminilitoris]|uniref:molybdopterin cofactor-binding domain-containing protein n=1 Tax=Sciscionella sediminilitoris TaxID=1445613 RepID=UPI0004DF328F|nr:molybdopterin cofactor-binding domain-containing protein [Sciscionella sp. SE31]
MAGHSRRRFLGYLLAAPTLAVAVPIGEEFALPGEASAALPSNPEIADLLDLSDLLNLAAAPTSGLVAVGVQADGTVSFALPRAEVGQGITTAVAMLIAEELDVGMDKVRVTLADARPELLFNQLTGGSNSMHSIYRPVRTAAAIARLALLDAAAGQWGTDASRLAISDGVVSGPGGRSAPLGSFAKAAAGNRTKQLSAEPKKRPSLIGTPQNRIDAHDAVTGRKQFTMDLRVPGALPTMVCRGPHINATVGSVRNLAEVRAMPGVTDIAVISTGVAVRANTTTHCIDAVRALRVDWRGGTVDGETDASVRAKLRAIAPPMPPPMPGAETIDLEVDFAFASNSALETNCAIADVRPDRAEIWAALKAPIPAHNEIAAKAGLLPTAVKVHVVQGGGSFGRKLFHDAALEATEASKAMGKPVKLMWHRTDDFRHGRVHPMSTSKIRLNHSGGNVLGYEQRHMTTQLDLGHGFGDAITSMLDKLPVADLTFNQVFFLTTQAMPYNFGITNQTLHEVPLKFHTSSMRNVYSPNVTGAREIAVETLAKKLGKDSLALRRSFAKEERVRAILDKVAELGEWGKEMPSGTAQGIGIHVEYKSCCAVLVEIDCRPETVHRPVEEEGVTGPRVTRATVAVDVGIPVNPRGLEAQMLGCVNDGIGLVLTESLHMDQGLPLEGSWDNFFYTRQWNTPLDVRVFVMPKTTEEPGGAGELGVAATVGAVACAYGRATGTMPTSFPINHGTLSFEPLPRVPPIPQSPTDGLEHTF